MPTTDSEPGCDALPGKLSQDQLAKLEESLGELGLASLLQTPRRRLTDAALGRAPVDLKDVEGLVATHLLSSDALASTLAEHTRDLVAFLFAQTKSTKKHQP